MLRIVNKSFRKICLCMTTLAMLVSPLSAGEKSVEKGVSYGICAHVSRGEHSIAQEELKLMRQAGITYIRTDFDWARVETKPGQWNYIHLDETVQWAQEAGIKVLPILDYDVKWATPAYQHLDLWTAYVRNVVTRYKDRVRVWEVWNEQNSHDMWRDKVSAANYVTLLRATYQTIKEIDSELTVLFGGTAGVPMEFIEGAYQAGAKDCFDAMNIHPYCYPTLPESAGFSNNIRQVRELMTRYGDADKPMWITEIGWPTYGIDGMLRNFITAGWKTLHPDKPTTTVAVLDDADFSQVARHTWTEDQLKSILGNDFQAQRITLPQLLNLNPAKNGALLLPLGEYIPGGQYFDAIVKYVQSGGVLISLNGVPFYYQIVQNVEGKWEKIRSPNRVFQQLHVGWDAYWTNPAAPNTTTDIKIADDFKKLIPMKDILTGTRYLNDKALKGNDRLIPMAHVNKTNFTGSIAAVYQFNSNLKGGLIITTFESMGRGCTPQHQALVLPRTYLLAESEGVDKMFWYEFQSPEGGALDRESHFGITHRDLSAKPAYTAMAALGRARPAGSVQTKADIQTGDVYHVNWTRPDGKTAWALWTVKTGIKVNLNIVGQVTECFDYLGNTQSLFQSGNQANVTVKPEVLYIVGPTQIAVNTSNNK